MFFRRPTSSSKQVSPGREKEKTEKVNTLQAMHDMTSSATSSSSHRTPICATNTQEKEREKKETKKVSDIDASFPTLRCTTNKEREQTFFSSTKHKKIKKE